MLKKILFVCLTATILFSCKKDKSDSPDYYLSAKFDGVQKEFNTSVFAQFLGTDPQSGYKLIVISSGGSIVNSLPFFRLEINHDEAITTKTYVTKDNQNFWEASGTYEPNVQISYDSNILDFTINITSITDTQVKGTFSGKMEEWTSREIITVTDGTFSAKLQ